MWVAKNAKENAKNKEAVALLRQEKFNTKNSKRIQHKEHEEVRTRRTPSRCSGGNHTGEICNSDGYRNTAGISLRVLCDALTLRVLRVKITTQHSSLTYSLQPKACVLKSNTEQGTSNDEDGEDNGYWILDAGCVGVGSGFGFGC